MEYKNIYGILDEVDNKVNEHLSKGYELYGGLILVRLGGVCGYTFDHSLFCQTMIKKDKKGGNESDDQKSI